MSTRADIALMIHSLAGGGAERSCLRLAKEFARRGLVVDLVLCSATGPYLRDIPKNIRIVDCAATSTVGWTRAVAQYFSQQPAPVLLAFMEGAGLVAILARLLTRTKVRVVVSPRNTISVHQNEMPRYRDRVITPYIYRAFLPQADHFIGISEGVSQDFTSYLRCSPSLVTTIYNPVVDEYIVNQAMELPDHPWLSKLAKYPRVIVSAGRLTRQKGFDILIQAFAKAEPERRDLQLIIFGEGEDREELERLAVACGVADRVALPGFTKNPFAAFARADLFVLSSRWEGFGNVLVEALSCACPVVSTDCPSGPSEILENGAWGPLVPVDDPDALAAAMISTLNKPPDRAALRRRGEIFSVACSADAYLAVLRPDGEALKQ